MDGGEEAAYVVLGTIAISHDCCRCQFFFGGEVGRRLLTQKRGVLGVGERVNGRKTAVGRKGRGWILIYFGVNYAYADPVQLQYISTRRVARLQSHWGPFLPSLWRNKIQYIAYQPVLSRPSARQRCYSLRTSVRSLRAWVISI